MSQVYDMVTNEELNTLIAKMLGGIVLKIPLNLLNDLNNDYCDLEFNIIGEGVSPYYNTVADNEIIVNSDFKITLSNRVFSHLNYYLKFKYYILKGDINDSNEDIFNEKVVKLSVGDNYILFEDLPVYLSSDIDLILKE